MTRPLHSIARDIQAEINSGRWSRKSSAYAQPYVKAMSQLSSIEDQYYCDSAESIVLYFLSNAATFRGETAQKLKAELKALIKESANV